MTDSAAAATPHDATEAPPSDRLPVAALLALAMTGFIAVMAETVPAGLLPLIGDGLGVSEAVAGQLVTLYAAGSLFAALPLTAATQGWRRRPLLLLAIVGLLGFNIVTTTSSSYALTLAARFLAGVAAGLAWGISAGYARRMVTPRLQGRAMALSVAGIPVALSLGVPAGTFLGGLVGWRATFMILSVLALGLIAWVLWKVPDFPGRVAERRPSVAKVFRTPGVRPVLLVVLAWMVAHNILYTYIAAFVAPAGLGARVDLVLLIFGMAALVGIWTTGLLVDNRLRVLILASLAGFALVAVALIVGGSLSPVIYPAVAAWGLTFGGASTLLNTAATDAAGEGVDVAAAMVTTAWNVAIAGGGLLGGALARGCGHRGLPVGHAPLRARGAGRRLALPNARVQARTALGSGRARFGTLGRIARTRARRSSGRLPPGAVGRPCAAERGGVTAALPALPVAGGLADHDTRPPAARATRWPTCRSCCSPAASAST